jgi:hypothetical protein
MSRYRINIEEKVTFNHEIIIESDKDVDCIDSILNDLDDEVDDLDDATRYLEENGCNILKVYRDDDGIDSEVESDDLEEIEESEDY